MLGRMVVRVEISGRSSTDVAVKLSPLAEMCAALHAFVGIEHHPASVPWVDILLARIGGRTRDQLATWAPLWGSQKSQLFYPTTVNDELELSDEIAGLQETPDAAFMGMIAESVVDGDPTIDYASLHTDRNQRDALLASARRLSADRSHLAAWLTEDLRGFRAALLSLLNELHPIFAIEWQTRRPELLAEARFRQLALRTRGWHSFEDLGATVVLDGGTADHGHLSFDKLSTNTTSLRDKQCILIPSWHLGSHIILKTADGYPLCVQYAPRIRWDRTLSGGVRERLAVLNDPIRVRICRLILRTPKTTLDIGRDLGMPSSQASRHLRKLREAGLARSKRDGRLVFYSLDEAAVSRLGVDFLDALRR